MLITSYVMAKEPVTPTTDAPTAKPKPLPIAIVPQDGFNLQIEEQLDPYNVIVKLTSPAHNWFAATFTNLPTDKEVTIGLSMAGNDTKGNEGNVKKWEGLRPVMTYADPVKYETYEWFQKDEQGRWVSGDPLKQDGNKYAGTGKMPEQSVIPKEISAQFLSGDGKYWSAWKEVDKSEVVANLNILRIKQVYSRSTATVAMRIPYTYTYLQQFLSRLKEAKLQGVFVDEAGDTPEKHKLQIIRFEPSVTVNIQEKRTIVVIAREHATEHASSWALQGLINSCISTAGKDKSPIKRTWLFIPIQDPDGSASSEFDRLTERMCKVNDPKTPSEVFSYATYFVNYINSGYTVDMSVVLHNVEANEAENCICPFIDARFPESVVDFNTSFFNRLRESTYITAAPEMNYGKGWMNFRLYGWLALHFGAFDIAYEVNDRYPKNILDLRMLTSIGAVLSASINDWVECEKGIAWHDSVIKYMKDRTGQRNAFFKERGYGPEKKSRVDLVMRGY